MKTTLSTENDFLSLEKGEASERTEQSVGPARNLNCIVPVFYLTRVGFRVPIGIRVPSGNRWSVLRFAPLSRSSAKQS